MKVTTKYQSATLLDKIPIRSSFFSMSFWACAGFLAAQRYTISPISSYLCLIPLAAALLSFNKDIERRNTLLLLALFWIVDQTATDLAPTASPVRYLIMFVALASFFHNATVRLSALIGALLAGATYTTNSLYNNELVDIHQFWQDTQLSILLLLLFCLKPRNSFTFHIPLLMIAMTGYLISECINFFFLSTHWHGNYMSYASTKYLICLPSLVAIFTKRTVLALTLTALTIPVLIGYTGRTLFLTYLASITLTLFFFSIRNSTSKRATALIFLITGVATLVQLSDNSPLDSHKALSTFSIIQEERSDSLRALDPVRYDSTRLFFQLPPLEILFGRGPGTGIKDTEGTFHYLSPDQFAFSEKELRSSHFYNFHDVWVDIGLRFGLLPFLTFLIWLGLHKPIENDHTKAIWVLVFIGISSAFYAPAGLMTIFLLARTVMRSRLNHE